ncbi:MAG TPA: methylmalonate-semialdehyde dehydrogenase (CoA acylating) [Verrucomicrobiales bacterium]|nr:methylmalonate-semialdehyde dehydrogenase (CoA acylating) [Verrucomicrobiales bacterium]
MRTIPVTSPLDGVELGQLHSGDASVVDQVVSNASRAFAQWSTVPIKERVQPLFRFKQRVEGNLNELAAEVTRENGKTREEAIAEIQRGLEVVEFACALPNLVAAEILEVSSGVDCFMRRLPLGVVAGITPFNFPAMVPMWMFPIAIVCGNTFVLKPSEQVPFTPLRLAELLQDSGLPDGVFNVIQGDRATVEALLDHPQVRAAAFVGSTPAARAVYWRGTQNGKRMLTLGGAKNHLIVVPDADPAVTAKNVVSSATGCAGQRCMAASVLIGVGKTDAILDAIQEEMAKVRPGVDLGPVISAQARDRIVGYTDRAESDGAVLRLDGRNVRVPGREGGFYVGPTLIDRLAPDSPCVREEIFGPVLSVLRVATLDEALAIENASPYGNAASIYTTNGAIARYFESRANAGMIGINIGVPVPREPFGFGGWNDSKFGVGDITGRDAIGFWTKTRKTTLKWTSRQTSWMG